MATDMRKPGVVALEKRRHKLAAVARRREARRLTGKARQKISDAQRRQRLARYIAKMLRKYRVAEPHPIQRTWPYWQARIAGWDFMDPRYRQRWRDGLAVVAEPGEAEPWLWWSALPVADRRSLCRLAAFIEGSGEQAIPTLGLLLGASDAEDPNGWGRLAG